MSNPELVGNWSEYQRLVLAELERHNKLLSGVDQRIQILMLQIELMKQEKVAREKLEKRVDVNAERITKLERAESDEDALKKYRGWIIGVLFLFITGLLIPIVNLVISTVGGD